ncbi:anaphase-promoting complex subunit cdc27 [Coemansia sp. Benny D115]|nr:anaphase-promoting complex subunit cdc27 [Coemansia sp. Benny D115]
MPKTGGRSHNRKLTTSTSRSSSTGVSKPAASKTAPTTTASAAAAAALASSAHSTDQQKQRLSQETQTDSENQSTGSLSIDILGRPQNETVRHYYESLVSRGISLLQPYSVLFIAEAYHSWYHSFSINVAESILQQTTRRRQRSCRVSGENAPEDHTDSAFEDSADELYDIRSVYWLALCYWHLGEVSTVYSLLTPITAESDYIIDQPESGTRIAETEGGSGSQLGSLAVRESPRLRSKKALACGLWLLAMSCTRLEKWQEAEDHLTALSGILKLLYAPEESSTAFGADTKIVVRDTTASLYALPTLADVSDLLGLVCVRTNRISQSEQHSIDAIRRNPLLWSSCRRLCEYGSAKKLEQALSGTMGSSKSDTRDFDETQEDPARAEQSLLDSTPIRSSRTPARNNEPGPMAPPPVIQRKNVLSMRQMANIQIAHSSRPVTANTPDSAAGTRMRTRLASQIPGAGLAMGGNSSSSNSSEAPGTNIPTGASASSRVRAPSLGIRAGADPRQDASMRSLSLAMARTPSKPRAEALPPSEKKRLRNGTTLRATSLSWPKTPSAESKKASISVDYDALSHIHRFFKTSAMVFVHTATHHAPEALLEFSMLPCEQQNSAWGLCLLGRICFEVGRYPEAAQAFGAAHQLAPHRVRDMDIYSTLLWHMKREEELACLAHKMISIGRNWSPEAWVAVANCFSLDGDHASALKSLGRSIQLYKAAHGGTVIVPRNESGGVSGLAYAHTLVGHESVAGDDLDRAQQAFRTAIRIDSRHYNAWYGMGTVYLRLGKLDLSEYHFRRALSLNSQNPLLMQSAGAVYEHRGDYASALEVYKRVEMLLQTGHVLSADLLRGGGNGKDKGKTEEALSTEALVTGDGTVVIGLQSHHAMNYVMFKRARVLVVLERFGEAATVLEKLLQRCPREFNVPFLLGQTYAKLHRYREAAACLTRALDIAPEHGQSVNEAFDALYQQSAEDQENIESEHSTQEDEAEEENYGATPEERAFMGYQRESLRDLRTPANNLARHGNMLSAGLSPSSPLPAAAAGSAAHLDSPLFYGRGGSRRVQAEWSHDWSALSNADDRVDRVLDFDM